MPPVTRINPVQIADTQTAAGGNLWRITNRKWTREKLITPSVAGMKRGRFTPSEDESPFSSSVVGFNKEITLFKTLQRFQATHSPHVNMRWLDSASCMEENDN